MDHFNESPVEAPAVVDSPTPLTPAMVDAVKGTGPWLRFFSILGFIGSGFMILAAVFMLIAGVFGAAFGEEIGGGAMMVVLSLVYGGMAVVYVLPCVFLFRAASAVVRAKRGQIAEGVEAALKHQKSFWKFVGIVMIVFLCLYPVLLIGIFFFGMAAAIAG